MSLSNVPIFELQVYGSRKHLKKSTESLPLDIKAIKPFQESKLEILSLPSSIFRSHCKGCFHICKLTFMPQCEHMAAFSILGKKGDQLGILVCIIGRLYLPDGCYCIYSLITLVEY